MAGTAATRYMRLKRAETEGFLEVVLDAIRKVLNTHDFFEESGILSIAIDKDYLNFTSYDKKDKKKVVDVAKIYH